MAKTITQRIQLQGGAEIAAGLKGIGDAGSAAFKQFQSVRDANAALASFGTSLSAVQKNLSNFATAMGNTGKKAADFASSVGTALGKITLLGGGVGASVGKLEQFFRGVGESNEALEQTAAVLGVTTGEAKGFQKALGAQGISAEEADTALNRLSKSIAEAAKDNADFSKKTRELSSDLATGKIDYVEYNKRMADLRDGTSDVSKAFKGFGVQVTDSSGELRGAIDVYRDMIAGSDRFTNSTRLTSSALAILGRSGGAYVKSLKSNVSEFDGFIEKGRNTISVLTKTNKSALDEMNIAFKQFDAAKGSIKKSVAEAFAPQVTSLLQGFTNALSGNKTAILGVAQAVSTQLQPLLDRLLATMADPSFGASMAAVLTGLVDGVKALGIAFNTIIVPAFGYIKAGADGIAVAINAVFGTQLTGGVILAGVALAKFTGLIGVLTSGFALLSAAGTALGALWSTALLPVFTALGVAIGVPTAAIAVLVASIAFLAIEVYKNWDGIKEASIALFASIGATISGWVAAASAAFDSVHGAIIGFLESIGQYFTDKWAEVQKGTLTAGQAIVQVFTDAFNNVKNAITSLASYVIDKFNAMIDRVKMFLGLSASADNGGDDAQSNAAGGMIRGRGTGTSDSILSWLSNGEFVLKAKAVKYYGPQLLHALNNLRLPKFATGGLASSLAASLSPGIPRFRDGGEVPDFAIMGEGMRPLTLHIGGDTVTGLKASPSALEQLTRHSVDSQMRSAGRKPTWSR